MPSSIRPPCKSCPKMGCGDYHSQCDKYLQYKANLEMAKAKNKELNKIAGFRGTKGLGNHYKPKKYTNHTGYRNDTYRL